MWLMVPVWLLAEAKDEPASYSATKLYYAIRSNKDQKKRSFLTISLTAWNRHRKGLLPNRL
jgi:hypothetical protein